MSIRSNRNQMDVFKIFVLFSSQQSKVSEWFLFSLQAAFQITYFLLLLSVRVVLLLHHIAPCTLSLLHIHNCYQLK